MIWFCEQQPVRRKNRVYIIWYGFPSFSPFYMEYCILIFFSWIAPRTRNTSSDKGNKYECLLLIHTNTRLFLFFLFDYLFKIHSYRLIDWSVVWLTADWLVDEWMDIWMGSGQDSICLLLLLWYGCGAFSVLSICMFVCILDFEYSSVHFVQTTGIYEFDLLGCLKV